jgi:hypothetical protein
MANYPLRDIGETSPHDPLELTEAAELHIMLLPSDQACAPAGGRDRGDLTGSPALRPPTWTGGISDGPSPDFPRRIRWIPRAPRWSPECDPATSTHLTAPFETGQPGAGGLSLTKINPLASGARNPYRTWRPGQ